ncbi:MAG: hypothetical protein RMY29_026590 [Nostoc sp. CreGUA01]|nr:hypothetical protein [Nostoc sp. CreGUA01]
MSDTIEVYQFSRNFDNPHPSAQHNHRWVSGGNIIDAEKKITLSNREVPQEIRQAVLDSYFAINDSYPPAENDFALIAREIGDRYAVLAVANGQIDDRDRPTIGYKYFWLETTDTDVDRIGTLIYWWRDDVKYKFDMEELNSALNPEKYHAQIQNKTNFTEHWLETIKETVNNFKQIPCIGVVTKEDWEGIPSYIKLHYLAFGLSIRSDNLNTWAWNVHKLSSPETFLYIWYSTQADIPANLYKYPLSSKIIFTPKSSKVSKLEPDPQPTNENQKSIPPDTENTDPVETENPETSNTSNLDNLESNFQWKNQNQNTPPHDTENQNPDETKNSDTSNNSNSDNSEKYSQSKNQNQNTPPHDTENQNPDEPKNRVQPPVQKIKSCLTELARSFHTRNQLDVNKAEELFGYLADYPNVNWSVFIDETTLKTRVNQSEIYRAEIYLIIDDDKQKWLIELLRSIHVEKKPLSFWDSLTYPIKNLLNQPPDNNNIFLLLEFQNQLLKESSKYDFQVHKRLQESIYYGITFFLRSLVNLNFNDPNDQKIAQQINYLLTEHQSIWSEYFQEYAYLVAKKVFYQPNIDISANNSVKKFCETIVAILEDIQNKKLDLHSRNRLYSKYKPLALIFNKINRTDLAELFYRISGSQVPKELLGKIPPEFKTKIFPTNYTPTPPSPPPNIIRIIIGIFLFVAVPVIYVAIYSKIFHSIGYPQVSCDQAGNWLVDYPTFESCYRNAEGYQKNIVIKDYMPDQTNIPYENQEKQKQKAKEFIDGTPKGNESEFKRRMAKLQECQKGKATEYGNCLDNKQQSTTQLTPNSGETKNKNECSLNSREQVKNCNNEQFEEIIKQAGFINIDNEYVQPLKQYLENTAQDENFEYKKNKSLQCFENSPYQETTKFQKCLKQSQKESVEELKKTAIKMHAEIIKYFPVKPNQNNQTKTN